MTLSWTANVGAESLEAASEEDPVVIEWTLTPVQCSQCTPRLFTSIAQITQVWCIHNILLSLCSILT